MMNGSDRWFRWCFNLFIFLMCMQLGMLLFLKSLFYRAEQRLKSNAAQVAFQCGDFNQNQNYWKLEKSQDLIQKSCDKEFCPESFWTQNTNQDTELHVLSVQKPRPNVAHHGKNQPGYFVNVHLKNTAKPYVLVLMSQSMMQWNLKSLRLQPQVQGPLLYKNHKKVGEWEWNEILSPHHWYEPGLASLQEVILVGPELVWVEGLPENTKLTYFSPQQMCNFPTDIREIKNSGNQFRRFQVGIEKYTGLQLTSFQGKGVGRELRVPFPRSYTLASFSQARGLSSQEKPHLKPGYQEMEWKRVDHKLAASRISFTEKGQSRALNLPTGTTQAYFEKATEQLFLIRNFQFGVWDQSKKQFQPLFPPLKVPALYWPTAFAFNPLRSEILIYNDDRGGEVYIYNVVTGEWQLGAGRVGYSLVALHFDSDTQQLLGVRHQGEKIRDLLKMDSRGQLVVRQPLKSWQDFAKNKWQLRLQKDQNQRLWIQLFHPASPEGEWVAL